jgi:hypothetical protein
MRRVKDQNIPLTEIVNDINIIGDKMIYLESMTNFLYIRIGDLKINALHLKMIKKHIKFIILS